MARSLAAIGRVYAKILEILIGGLLTLMIGVEFAAVAARYLLADVVSLYWAEEVVRYSFIWTVFLVSPLVIRRGANLELDIFLHGLSPRTRRAINRLNTAVILAFLVVLVFQGAVMVRVNTGQLSSALELPMAWIYLAVPVGGVLMLAEYLAVAVRSFGHEPETAPRTTTVAVE